MNKKKKKWKNRVIRFIYYSIIIFAHFLNCHEIVCAPESRERKKSVGRGKWTIKCKLRHEYKSGGSARELWYMDFAQLIPEVLNDLKQFIFGMHCIYMCVCVYFMKYFINSHCDNIKSVLTSLLPYLHTRTHTFKHIDIKISTSTTHNTLCASQQTHRKRDNKKRTRREIMVRKELNGTPEVHNTFHLDLQVQLFSGLWAKSKQAKVSEVNEKVYEISYPCHNVHINHIHGKRACVRVCLHTLFKMNTWWQWHRRSNHNFHNLICNLNGRKAFALENFFLHSHSSSFTFSLCLPLSPAPMCVSHI